MQIKEKVRRTTGKVAQEVARVTKTTAYRWTQYFILAISVVFVLADIILPLNDLPGISDLLKDWAFGKGFVLAWIWGVLGGHLFITRTEDARLLDEILSISILVIVSLALLCVACCCHLDGHVILNIILLMTGCIAGYFLWPQLPAGTGDASDS